jgi:hypothetical protein
MHYLHTKKYGRHLHKGSFKRKVSKLERENPRRCVENMDQYLEVYLDRQAHRAARLKRVTMSTYDTSNPP